MMPFPTDTFLQFIRASASWTSQEFEHFYAQLEGYLRVNHKEDGTHAAVEADSVAASSVTVTETPGVAESGFVRLADALGGAATMRPLDDGLGVRVSTRNAGQSFPTETTLVDLGRIDPGVGIAAGSGFQIPGAQDTWSIVEGKDTYGNFWGWFNSTFGTHAMMKLYRTTTGMALAPPSGASGQVWALGSPDSSALHWDEAYIDQINPASGVGWGEWQAYTPAWSATGTAPSLGDGTLTGRYTQIGKTIHAMLTLAMGSTTTYGTGVYTFTVPVTSPAIGSLSIAGTASIFDASAALFYSAIIRQLTTTTFTLIPIGSGTAQAGPTNPVTFAQNDQIGCVFTYEAA